MSRGHPDWINYAETVKLTSQELKRDMIEFSGTLYQFINNITPVMGIKFYIQTVTPGSSTDQIQIGTYIVQGSGVIQVKEISYGGGMTNLVSLSNSSMPTNAIINCLYKTLTSDHLTSSMLSITSSGTSIVGTVANTVDNNISTYLRCQGDGANLNGNATLTITYPFKKGDVLWVSRDIQAYNGTVSFSIQDEYNHTLHSESVTASSAITITKSRSCVSVTIPNDTSLIKLNYSRANNILNSNYVSIYEMDVIPTNEQI